MPKHFEDLTRQLNDHTRAICLALDQAAIVGKCVRCGCACGTVVWVSLDFVEVYLSLPLRVCRRCVFKAPFAGAKPDVSRNKTLLKWTDWLRNHLSFRWMLTKSSTTDQPISLKQLVNSVPVYRDLLSAVPDLEIRFNAQQTPVYCGNRNLVNEFLQSVYQRHSLTYLINADEVAKSGIPDVVLSAYPEIFSLTIEQSIRESGISGDLISHVGAVLLPNRRWEFDIQLVGSQPRLQLTVLERALRDRLSAVIAWPVAYPLTFVVTHRFEFPGVEFNGKIRKTFAGWFNRVKLVDGTYGQHALSYYQISPVDQPISFSMDDCATLRNLLPANISLKAFHARLHRDLGNFADAIKLYDEILIQDREHESAIYERLGCLALSGQLERAAAECQQWTSQAPLNAHAHALMANLQLDLNLPEAALQEIDTALSLNEVADYYRLRGRLLANLSRFDESLTSANRAIFCNRNCASAHLLKAQLHSRSRRTDEAHSSLDECDRCAGISVESLQLRVRILSDSGRVSETEHAFRKAIQASPSDLQIRLMWAEFLARAGKLESARAEVDRMIQDHHEFGQAYSLRAAVELELKQPDLAIRDASEAIRLLGESAHSLMVRGLAHAINGDVEQGLNDLDACLEIAPEFDMARIHRGRLRFAQEEFESAIEDFTAALQSSPDWVDALLERGAAWMRLEDYENAQQDFDQAIQIEPTRADAYTGRAVNSLAKGKKDAAAADLDQAILLDPTNVCGRLNRAKLLLQQSEIESATDDLNQILAENPKFSIALWERAHVNLWLGRLSDAAKDFDELIEINPDSPESFIRRSVVFELMGDMDQANADRDEATRLDPSSSEELLLSRRLLIAQIANHNEQFEMAIEIASQIIDENPESPIEAYRTRGHSHWYREDFVEALEDYEYIIQNSDQATRHDFSARGQVLNELGEYGPGLESLDQAIAIAKDQGDSVGLAYCLNGRGRSLTGLGRYEEAELAYLESLKRKPDNAWLHYNRGLTCMEQNDVDKALACFELSLTVSSPKLPPAKRRRAEGFIQKMKTR